MGDIADWLLERMLDEGYWSKPYSAAREITCSRCGTAGLIWGVDKGRWALFDSRTLDRHTCPPAGADEFEPIP